MPSITLSQIKIYDPVGVNMQLNPCNRYDSVIYSLWSLKWTEMLAIVQRGIFSGGPNVVCHSLVLVDGVEHT